MFSKNISSILYLNMLILLLEYCTYWGSFLFSTLQCLNNIDIFQVPDPRNIQIQLTGFLQGKNARIFVGELWELLVSAQENIGGIPTAFLEKKKEEIRLRKVRKVQVSFKVKVSF